SPRACEETQESTLALRRCPETPKAFHKPTRASVVGVAFIERGNEGIGIQQNLIHHPAQLRLQPLHKPRRATEKRAPIGVCRWFAEDLAEPAPKLLCPGKCSRVQPWLWLLGKHLDLM